ncbi:hypothetical protein [Paenibacillus polymyxa]|nr:hypothetical protein [Paenibacillus polymyxa]
MANNSGLFQYHIQYFLFAFLPDASLAVCVQVAKGIDSFPLFNT